MLSRARWLQLRSGTATQRIRAMTYQMRQACTSKNHPTKGAREYFISKAHRNDTVHPVHALIDHYDSRRTFPRARL